MSHTIPPRIVARLAANCAAWDHKPYYSVQPDGCWHWERAIGNKGYGLISWKHEGAKVTMVAHRAYYLAFRGAIPNGHDIDHLCRKRSCVNPEHLEAVTHLENARRGSRTMASGVYVPTPLKTHCKYGHEFSPENTRISKTGARQCLACGRRNRREYKAKLRAAGITLRGASFSSPHGSR